jgi:3-methyladenine DNA glycosylase AlkD
MNDSADILARLRRDLAAAADPATLAGGPRFFKEPVRLYGVKTARVHAIAREYLKDLKGQDKRAVFALCDGLWASGWLEETFIACDWAYARRAEFEPADLDVFERWLGEHVSNWASCDTLCNHTIGALLESFPARLPRLKGWCASPSRWLRRGAAVSLILPARKGLFQNEIFTIAETLLEDEDDLVRKGCGWLLKAASEADRAAVFDFVMANRARMPRVALRYAIEKMPPEMRAKAMGK